MESPFLHATGLLRYIGLFLSGICHQFPEHSVFLGDTQLPLCARCTGTYLGAMASLVVFLARGRWRAARLPPMRIFGLLVLFFILWAIDGLNSYLAFATGRVMLYPPNNTLRLWTGMGNGLLLISLVYPMLNYTLWESPAGEPVIANWRELGTAVAPLPILALLAQRGNSDLLAPFALWNLVGVVIMLAMVNSMILLILMRRESRARTWRDAAPMLLAGLALGVAEVCIIAAARLFVMPRYPPPVRSAIVGLPIAASLAARSGRGYGLGRDFIL